MKYTPATKKKIREALELGLTQKEAQNIAGIHPDTFHTWMKEKPEFSEMVKSALDNGKAEHLKNIRKAAKKHWQASAWWLERKFPQEWGKRNDLNMNLDLNSLSDEALEKIAAGQDPLKVIANSGLSNSSGSDTST